MERLTECAQGYCEMYCKKYILCFEDPENCVFKDEIKLYDALKSIEGIVPLDRLLELACADKDGLIPPCKRGDVVYCIRHNPRTGYRVKPLNVCTVTVWGPGHFTIFTTKEDTLGKTVFLTREEAEAALAGKGDANEADTV